MDFFNGNVVPQFVSVWKTDNPGDSNSTTINLPLVAHPSNSYNCVIDWGDGSKTDINGVNVNTAKIHTYSTTGTYTVRITGMCRGFGYWTANDKLKLLEIKQWGKDFMFGTPVVTNNFYGCSNLTITATDVANTTGVTSFNNLFNGCTSITSIPKIGQWDVSQVTSMGNLFLGTQFNSDISAWNTSSCTDMNRMFMGSPFNQNIGSWDVSKVTDFSYMFYVNTHFNQNIGSWNTGSATNMYGMFASASDFNQNLNSWNVSNVTTMGIMFNGCSVFNGNISSWITSKVTVMNNMFDGCSAFNQDISLWNTSSVENMDHMFNGCTVFNQDISEWDVSKVMNMFQMFGNCTVFNQDISEWDVSKVTSINRMFLGTSIFNQPIGSWDTSSVIDMSYVFYNIGTFNQDISNWNVSNVTTLTGFVNIGYSFTTAHYDAMLISWETQAVQSTVTFGMGNTKYSGGASEVARAALISDHGWTITDGGIITTTLNPSDLSGITLSLGNLKAEKLGTGGSVRSVSSHTFGKFYCEATVGSAVNDADALGIATIDQDLTSSHYIGETGNYSVGFYREASSGRVYKNGASISTFPNYTNGDILSMAVDITNSLIWFRVNGGNWNNDPTADPSTGTNGFEISPVASSPIYACFFVEGSSSNFTMNFGATAYSYTPPTGFLHW
jgi:surface protein